MKNYGVYASFKHKPSEEEMVKSFSLLTEQAIRIVQSVCGAEEREISFEFYSKPEIRYDPLTKWEFGFKMRIQED